MKSTKTVILFIATIILFSQVVNSVNLHSCLTRVEKLNNLENIHEKKPKSANLWDLTGFPICIDDSDPDSNWSKTVAENSWCSGNGTQGNPYIIENVIINGQELSSCIEIKNSNAYFIIRNCTLYNSGKDLDNEAGIKLEIVRNGKLHCNNISFNSNGIFFYNGRNNNVSGNLVINNSGVGIKFEFGRENIIAGNYISNNSGGIFIRTGYVNRIFENIVCTNVGSGINFETGSSTTVSGNRVYNNTNSGISLFGGSDFDIIKNQVRYNEKSGIEIDGMTNNISRNMVNNNNFGIYLNGGRGNNEILRNNISYNNNGMYLLTSYDNKIIRNNVSNNKNIGIYLENTIDYDIIENSVRYNNNGVYLLTSQDIKVFRNNVSNNRNIGIWLENSNINDIIENNIANNEIGINLGGQRNTIKNNTINNNVIGIFISNAKCNKISENIFNDNTEDIHGTQEECNPFPIGIVIALIVIIILMGIIAGKVIFKRKSSKIETNSQKMLNFQEIRDLQKLEEEKGLEKGQHFCVVHRGKIVGAVYLCPTCGTYYCMNCATVLKNRGETCWGCNNEIKF